MFALHMPKIAIRNQSGFTNPSMEYDSNPIQVNLIGLCVGMATVKHIHNIHSIALWLPAGARTVSVFL